jgi:hypothetical protein
MKKISVNLLTGQVEAQGQSAICQIVIVFLAASFLVTLAYLLKGGFVVLLLRKITMLNKIKALFSN